MCINLNPNEIKKIIVNTDNLPKTKSGKNNRMAMIEGLEHGHQYKIGITIIYSDWDEYNTEFLITKILENREWVNVKDVGEKRFGSFSLLFNSLLAGTFKKEAQEQSDRYFRLVNEMNSKVNQANKETDEAKAVSKKFKAEKEKAELESSILRADKVLLEGQVENQLMVIQEQRNEIVALKEQLKTVKTVNSDKKLSRLIWRKLIREIVTKYNSGTPIDKLVDYVLEFLEK